MSYMTDTIFDYGASVLTKIKLGGDQTLFDDSLDSVVNSYCESYSSEVSSVLKDQWIQAVNEYLEIFKLIDINENEASFICENFGYYRKNYDRDGKKKGFFQKIGGTRFQKGNFDRYRVKNSSSSFKSYCILFKAGTLPSDWIKP